jgi:hypothetical protein
VPNHVLGINSMNLSSRVEQLARDVEIPALDAVRWELAEAGMHRGDCGLRVGVLPPMGTQERLIATIERDPRLGNGHTASGSRARRPV